MGSCIGRGAIGNGEVNLFEGGAEGSPVFLMVRRKTYHEDEHI